MAKLADFVNQRSDMAKRVKVLQVTNKAGRRLLHSTQRWVIFHPMTLSSR